MNRRLGRADALFVFLLFLFWVLLLLGGILRLWALLLLSIPFGALASLRIFFPGALRERENALFLRIVFAPIRKLKDRKYAFFVCPSCSARIRVLKKSGNFRILCPRCRTYFSVSVGKKGERP